MCVTDTIVRAIIVSKSAPYMACSIVISSRIASILVFLKCPLHVVSGNLRCIRAVVEVRVMSSSTIFVGHLLICGDFRGKIDANEACVVRVSVPCETRSCRKPACRRSVRRGVVRARCTGATSVRCGGRKVFPGGTCWVKSLTSQSVRFRATGTHLVTAQPALVVRKSYCRPAGRERRVPVSRASSGAS